MVHAPTAPPPTTERRLPMSYEEWLVFAEQEGPLSEWVDGEVIVFEMPKGFHQDALGFLYILLRLYVGFFDLGVVRPAPFIMRLSDRRSRVPDILFVARANLARLSDERLDGGADLVIELMSDDSVARDGRVKRAEYAAAGVPEYWIVDPRPGRQTATFLRLDGGDYVPVSPDAEGRYHSRVLTGFWLRPEWLWRDPEADPPACLSEIAPAAFGPGR